MRKTGPNQRTNQGDTNPNQLANKSGANLSPRSFLERLNAFLNVDAVGLRACLPSSNAR